MFNYMERSRSTFFELKQHNSEKIHLSELFFLRWFFTSHLEILSVGPA